MRHPAVGLALVRLIRGGFSEEGGAAVFTESSQQRSELEGGVGVRISSADLGVDGLNQPTLEYVSIWFPS